jgi:hypothetical protein
MQTKKRPALPQAKIHPSLSADPSESKVRFKIGYEIGIMQTTKKPRIINFPAWRN